MSLSTGGYVKCAFTIQCDFLIEAHRPDIAVVDKRKKKNEIIYIAIRRN